MTAGVVAGAARLADRIGITSSDPALLAQALVHGSYLHEHPDAARGNNERLEFLGDSVVNLVISEALYARHPDDDEGELSARRAAIVSTQGLASLALRIGLGEDLLLGEGEHQRGGRTRPSVLASTFEAVAGAVFLSSGYARTRTWLVRLAGPELRNEASLKSLKSPKSRLQELIQQERRERPAYHVVETSGPDHERSFLVEVRLGDVVLGTGSGASLRVAETAAASRALEALAGPGPDPCLS